jgi:hypothetical protein
VEEVVANKASAGRHRGLAPAKDPGNSSHRQALEVVVVVVEEEEEEAAAEVLIKVEILAVVEGAEAEEVAETGK